jgi:nucleotide-binding universal stress UspA family protein
MSVRPAILCPIDFSEGSVAALQYTAAIAEHVAARVIVLTVEDPLLTTAMDLGTGTHWTREASENEMAKFVAETFGGDQAMLAMCEYDVALGKPPVEILRVGRERSCDLIVMSSHGLTGARKLFFGSTTERVLRETTVPILVTPPANPGPIHIEDAKRLLGRIVVPVDVSPASVYQTQAARMLAETLNLPLVLVHVIEPVKSRLLARLSVTGLDANRRAAAEESLDQLVATIPRRIRPEALIVFGDPAEEAAKVVRDRKAGLVVMGLHGTPLLGPRMGSVTYRMLCLSQALVLALPPKWADPARRQEAAPADVASEAVH